MVIIRDEYYSSQQKSVLQSTYAAKLLRSNNNGARLCRYFSLVLTNFMYHVLQCRTLSARLPFRAGLCRPCASQCSYQYFYALLRSPKSPIMSKRPMVRKLPIPNENLETVDDGSMSNERMAT